MENGAVLQSGDRFQLSIELPELSYLYVVLISPNDQLSRLYPATVTGSENPVRGTVLIPNDFATPFRLDATVGIERLIIFAQRDRSETLEQLVEVAGKPGQSQAPNLTRLADATRMRGAFVDAPVGGVAASSVSSILGQPVAQFLIDHR